MPGRSGAVTLWPSLALRGLPGCGQWHRQPLGPFRWGDGAVPSLGSLTLVPPPRCATAGLTTVQKDSAEHWTGLFGKAAEIICVEHNVLSKCSALLLNIVHRRLFSLPSPPPD